MKQRFLYTPPPPNLRKERANFWGPCLNVNLEKGAENKSKRLENVTRVIKKKKNIYIDKRFRHPAGGTDHFTKSSCTTEI